MNRPKYDGIDDIHFLIAVQKFLICTEVARCQPKGKSLLSMTPSP